MCMDPFCLVTEYLENGSLIKLLKSDQPIDWNMKLFIMKGIAAGKREKKKRIKIFNLKK